MGYPPIIVTGMHRAGTTLLARILEEMGVFMGNKKDQNNESVFFQRLNEWIFTQANATWDNPYNFRFINEGFVKEVKDVLEIFMRSVKRIDYIGLKNFFRYRDIRLIDFPWGWKDPRNTFTAEIWLEIFKEAKVLHIYRNPIDVAMSLNKREQNFELVRSKWYFKGYYYPKTKYIPLSFRVQNIEESIKLWEEYMRKIYDLNRVYKDIYHIKYEDLIENPLDELKKCAYFASLSLTDKVTDKICSIINKNSCYAFSKDKKLVEIYKRYKNRDLFKKAGYNNII